MFIKNLQVFNYKSYLDSGLIEFSPGINIIVGRNHAGKTSLLEVLTLNFENHPHRSLKTLPNKLLNIEEESKIEITLHLQKEELRNFIKYYLPQFLLPLPYLDNIGDEIYLYYIQGYSDREYDFNYENIINHVVNKAFQSFKSFVQSTEDIELKLRICCDNRIDNSLEDKLTNFSTYPHISSSKYFYRVLCDKSDNMHLEEDSVYDIYYDIEEKYKNEKTFVKHLGKLKETIGYKVLDIFENRIYMFRAERLNIGVCKFEKVNHSVLKSDASNLAEVLFILQQKIPGKFSQFNELVSRILPEIKYISVRIKDDSVVEIFVWNTENLHRDDLSISLSSSGSGVSQILAIVYILVSSDQPRTIIIDEPQSFLHPGAAKKLIETIKQFPQHQYFIATHSPEIIASANPSNILKLQYQDCETTASVINTNEIKSQNEILAELGVRLSDVFGADNILWVEGQTEEKCFPLVLEKVASIPLMGIKILSVNSTDALLDGKRSDLVFDIYKKLTTGATLFPPAIGFIFDRENKTEAKIQELEKRGANFLRLPMYENYLLDPESISMVINEEARWLETPISITQVQEYLDKIKQEKSYLLQGVKREQISDNNWLYKIHGAKILESMFQELCENKLEFRKTKHSYKLTEWLVENKPDFLSELAEELGNYLKKNQ
ncbi:hypothetical protein FACHB389_20785 [Nostoc calcicola FACHB-389]|nr:AAA family ATPase [Nostoc calcicola FACHB-3891]OKH31826.1 hypothetical protein FACHB389_20785 [Nostoc calcicola FACHB-389]